MFEAIFRHWHNLTASRKWQVYGDIKGGTFRMRRWAGDRFEYRECTAEEAEDAHWHWAIR